MGKFHKWVNDLEEAVKSDIEAKIYYELMKAWGQTVPTPEFSLLKAANSIKSEIDKTLEGYIDQIDMSSEA